MKKVLLLLGLLAMPAALFAQGTVQFKNDSSTRMQTNSLVINGGTGSIGNTSISGAYTVGLYMGTFGANPDTFSLVGTTPAQSGIGAGNFNGGTAFVVNGNNGTLVSFQIRAWSTAAGTTYEQAIGVRAPNTFAGVSGVGFVTPATGTAATPLLFGTDTAAGQLNTGFQLNLQPVPEPSSIALGLLGLGAIALFRRKK